jgi:serine/threonine protein kinase/formylglycine-generating enzyme required for sulfatase activity
VNSARAEFESLLVAALQAMESEGPSGLDSICTAHPQQADALRREIERLRAAGLAGTLAEPLPPPTQAPRRIGNYEIIRPLGVGGMGEVYLARQREPIARDVALKVVRGGLVTPEARARFALERQVLSELQHDGIARVYEAGETAAGEPYFAMEYVAGKPLSSYCDERQLPLPARLELLCRVCDAVQHAHQHGVIHRDLKPGNVLVKEQDGAPVAKVIDFGLAKQLAPVSGSPELTRSGLILGTLDYMSPEQADADTRDVDTRSDVYGLGAMLYEQLTGTRPLTADASSLLTFLTALRDREPPRPSARAHASSETTARARGFVSAKALARAVRGDLDWIALRALAKRPDDRYGSAAELAADLRNHLARRPVRAHPPSWWYATSRLVARHRTATLATTIVLALGCAGLWRELANLGELRRRDARYDALALRPRLQRLREAGIALLRTEPGRAHDAPAQRDWQRAAQQLVDERTAYGPVAATPAEPTDQREAWLQQGLQNLDAELRDFAAPGGELDRVARRVRWAEGVRQATLVDAAALWQTAIASIADRQACPGYDGLTVSPQLGLIPLRRNPASGLWEFRWWHPDGAAPRFDAEGRLLNPTTCDPVFVLLPGGSALIGSSDDDALAADVEKPRHRVDLAPFFIGKYELTRGQWLRWTGLRPGSQAHAQTRHAVDDAHPVGDVSWFQASYELWEWGLRLPTEAQWEYAARAGTTTPWWSGADPLSLRGNVNLADAATVRGRVPTPWHHDELDDGFPLTAPVDALGANPFGLHHMLGNVWEWCAGHYAGSYADGIGHRAGDGFLLVSDQYKDGDERIARGGSYLSTWNLTRCAQRVARPRKAAGPESGMRVARPSARPQSTAMNSSFPSRGFNRNDRRPRQRG